MTTLDYYTFPSRLSRTTLQMCAFLCGFCVGKDPLASGFPSPSKDQSKAGTWEKHKSAARSLWIRTLPQRRRTSNDAPPDNRWTDCRINQRGSRNTLARHRSDSSGLWHQLRTSVGDRPGKAMLSAPPHNTLLGQEIAKRQGRKRGDVIRRKVTCKQLHET